MGKEVVMIRHKLCGGKFVMERKHVDRKVYICSRCRQIKTIYKKRR